MSGSKKSDIISTFLTSAEGTPLEGIREPARYAFRCISAWASGQLTDSPRMAVLENKTVERAPETKMFLPLLGRLHLKKEDDSLTVDAGELALVLSGNPHGETWELTGEGHYLQLFIRSSSGKLSLNIAGKGGPCGLPEKSKIYAAAHMTHTESSVLISMLDFIQRHPGRTASMCTGLAAVLQTGLSVHRLKSNSDLIRRALGFLNANPCDPDLSVQWVAEQLDCHPDTLSRRFRSETGLPFMTALTQARMAVAADLLKSGTLAVSDVALLCGYRDHSYFSRVFHRHHGCPPSALSTQNK